MNDIIDKMILKNAYEHKTVSKINLDNPIITATKLTRSRTNFKYKLTA